MKRLLLLLLLPLLSNCIDAPKTDILYEDPQSGYNQIECEINATDNSRSISWIMYKYFNANIAEIILFGGDAENQNKGIDRALFQKCVADIIAHNCTKIFWTVNPIDNIDVETLRIIYQKLMNKLENSESYQLTYINFFEDNKTKIKMILSLKKNGNEGLL